MNTTEKVKALQRAYDQRRLFWGDINQDPMPAWIAGIPDVVTSYFELLEERDRYKTGLEEIEWQAHDHFCYVCTAEKCKGHFPDCPIGKALSPDTND